jgi:hypothetical protein
MCVIHSVQIGTWTVAVFTQLVSHYIHIYLRMTWIMLQILHKWDVFFHFCLTKWRLIKCRFDEKDWRHSLHFCKLEILEQIFYDFYKAKPCCGQCVSTPRTLATKFYSLVITKFLFKFSNFFSIKRMLNIEIMSLWISKYEPSSYS